MRAMLLLADCRYKLQLPVPVPWVHFHLKSLGENRGRESKGLPVGLVETPRILLVNKCKMSQGPGRLSVAR